MIRLATVFSGIGAIESALKYLDIPFEIVFACDNGERTLPYSNTEIQEMIKRNKIELDEINSFIKELLSIPSFNIMELLGISINDFSKESLLNLIDFYIIFFYLSRYFF